MNDAPASTIFSCVTALVCFLSVGVQHVAAQDDLNVQPRAQKPAGPTEKLRELKPMPEKLVMMVHSVDEIIVWGVHRRPTEEWRRFADDDQFSVATMYERVGPGVPLDSTEVEVVKAAILDPRAHRHYSNSRGSAQPQLALTLKTIFGPVYVTIDVDEAYWVFDWRDERGRRRQHDSYFYEVQELVRAAVGDFAGGRL